LGTFEQYFTSNTWQKGQIFQKSALADKKLILAAAGLRVTNWISIACNCPIDEIKKAIFSSIRAHQRSKVRPPLHFLSAAKA
jgi:hypothetical protein